VARELCVCCAPDGLWRIEWQPASAPPPPAALRLQEALAAEAGDGWLVRLACADRALPLSAGLQFLRDFLGAFADWMRHTPEIESLRATLPCQLPAATLAAACAAVPAMEGAEYVGAETLTALWDRLLAAGRAALAAHPGTVAAFLQQLNPELHLAGRVYFHLVENRQGSATPFAFMATYSQADAATGRVRHVPLRHALTEYAGDAAALLHLLGTVHRAAAASALLRALVDSGELFHPLGWQTAEAFAFLREIPLYDASGIVCRIPDWWKSAARGVRLSLTVGGRAPAGVGLQAILDCKPQLTIDGEPIPVDEVRRLLAESNGLALIKGRWVAVDPERLRLTLEAFERLQQDVTDGLPLTEALRMQLDAADPDAADPSAQDRPEVTAGAWLAETLRRLTDPAACETVTLPSSFRATLRPYQQQGLHWLACLWQLGFGACLADDMGLGKTVQLLALLSVRRATKDEEPSLLVIPASLLANWQAEIGRFLPSLRVLVLHASAMEGGKIRPPDRDAWRATDLVITTYALVARLPWFAEQAWQAVILDEAQAIKNPGTRQTRAVKKLRAPRRIAMTGTPVENRLGDLWSLFDFLNPGLLGTADAFTRFSASLHDHPAGYTRLRQIIRPYVLRRLKTDRSIIADLPDKVESKTFATLCARQAVLYRQVLAELERQLEVLEGIERKGLVLATLLRCKQICNHPDHYLGTGVFAESDSGKFERLREICETVQAKRERMLVFTQFREMAGPLSDFLAGVFGRPGLVMHGGIPPKQRGALVAQFQGDEYVPYFVLTVKAGGVGLNLTRANHVVHFDRWWNPAVENQATDRAFRIGQRRDVLVHKFVVSGTIEERIDAMIEGKRKLASDVIASGGAEAVLTAMNNRDLLNMFRLTL
jgi:non-specific serine/threonine protein kinase